MDSQRQQETQDNAESRVPTTNALETSASRQEENAQLWKDIETRTGYTSYTDYVVVHMDEHPEFPYLLRQCRASREERSRTPRIQVYDILQEEDHPATLNLRSDCRSGIDVVRAVHQPPNKARVQLVLLPHSEYTEELIDALALGLNLEPEILEVILYNGCGDITSPLTSRRQGWPYLSKYVVTDELISIVLWDSTTKDRPSVPTVLIAPNLWAYFLLRNRRPNRFVLAVIRPLPLSKTSSDEDDEVQNFPSAWPNIIKDRYLEYLRMSLAQNQKATMSKALARMQVSLLLCTPRPARYGRRLMMYGNSISYVITGKTAVRDTDIEWLKNLIMSGPRA